MDRESFIKTQAHHLDQRFLLTTGEEQARTRFEKLALDTYDLYPAAKKPSLCFSILPKSAGNFLSGYGQPDWKSYLGMTFPEELIERWKQWNTEYYEMRARNPRLELRDLIQDCSETHDFSSWPTSPWEADIFHWILSGSWDEPPFNDRKKIIDEEFFLRLREIHDQCRGWLFKEKSRVVFLPDAEALTKPLFFRR